NPATPARLAAEIAGNDFALIRILIPMASVGTVLKAEREQQGRTIDQIAEELCLMPSYLRAIEADDLQNLPAVFFYKSFVRQYAALLGVRMERLQADIEVLTAMAEPEAAVIEKP